MDTRCFMLALYVIYENPMPMVADTPQAYEGQPGFEFLAKCRRRGTRRVLLPVSRENSS